MAFEYNGEQHYKYNAFFHKESNDYFTKLQERDALTIELCEQNNILLIVIPYTYDYKNVDKLRQFIEIELDKYGKLPLSYTRQSILKF